MNENPKGNRHRRPVRNRQPGKDAPMQSPSRPGQLNRRRTNGNIPPPKKQTPPTEKNQVPELLGELFSSDNIKYSFAVIKAKLKLIIGSLFTNIFLAKERIICGTVTGVILLFLALLQTTVFSTIKPFGSIPDLMLSFTLALSVTEGRKWGAAWGIAAAVVIESLNVPEVYLLPLLYMAAGYFGGILCRHYLTESFAVRAILAVASLPLKGAFTAVYAVLSPLYITPGEIFFEIVLPEAAATLLLAAPVHLLVYLCMKPFHHTRAEMVSEKM